MKREKVSYQIDGESYSGWVLDEDPTVQQRSAIIVAHAWMGNKINLLNKKQKH